MKYTVFNVNVFGEYERVRSFHSESEAEKYVQRKMEDCFYYDSREYDCLLIELEGVDA